MTEDSIIRTALGKPDPADRAAYLDTACAGDTELRERVEQHLRDYAATVNFPAPSDPGRTDAGAAATRTGLIDAMAVIAPSSEPGSLGRVGQYEVLGELGRGGMGVVFKARQAKLNRVVALKMVLSADLATSEQLVRFMVEGEVLARLDHPNIVRIHELGTHAGRPYFALEYVDGGSLAQRLDGKPWAPAEAAGLIEALARAVQYAHAQGVIHRDLKPGNILLAGVESRKVESRKVEDGQPAAPDVTTLRRYDVTTPKISDFGLAKRIEGNGSDLTRTGSILGTPSYMAPEQARGRSHVGPAVDVYALGAILYHLLAGRPPFAAETAIDTLNQVTTREPDRLPRGVPRDLAVIVMKCLAKDPARRYASAAALADDLERFRTGRPITARPAGTAERAWRWARRNPAVAALLLGLVAVGLAGVAGIAWKWREAEANAAEARRNAETAGLNADTAAANARTAEENARRSREAAELAERNHGFATEAVDQYLNTLTDDPRLQQPELAPLRRELLESARKFYLRFVAERKDDPAARRGLGMAYLRLAALAGNIEKDIPAALEYVRQARELFEALLAESPDDPRRLADLAWSYRDAALAHRMAERWDESLAAADRAVALQERAAEQTGTPKDRATLADLLHLAGVAASRSDSQRAEAIFRREIGLREPLAAADPGDHDRRYRLAIAGSWHASTLSALNRTAEAGDRYRTALDQLRGLAAEFPRNVAYRSYLGNTLRNYAVRVLARTSATEALAVVREAIGHQQFAFEQYQGFTAYRERLWLDYKAAADLYLRLGEYHTAAAAASAAGRLYLNSPSVAYDTVARLHRCAAAARANQSLTPMDRERAAQSHLDQAEPFRAMAAKHTPTAPGGKLILAGWLAEYPAAPADHLAHARTLAHEVIDLQPKSRAPWAALGLAEYRAGNWYEARAALEAAQHGTGPVGSEGFALAMTLWVLGEADEARAAFDRAAAAATPQSARIRKEAEITLGLAPAPPVRAWDLLTDADRAEFDRWVARMAAAGFEPTFVNTVATADGVRYSAVAASDLPVGAVWRVRTDKTVADFQKRFDGETADRFWLVSLTGHAVDTTAGYVSVWRQPMPPSAGLCRHLAPADGFRAEAEKQRAVGNRPTSVSGFRYAGGFRLTTVYGTANGRAWEIHDGLAADRLPAAVEEGRLRAFRPAVVYAEPGAGATRFGVVLVQDDAFTGWEFRTGLTGEEVRRENDRLRPAGFRPDQVVGYEDGGAVRFAAVWVRERSLAAAPNRPMSGTPVPELAGFDRAMQKYMKDRDISAGAIAVMKDGKLVLARGYGYADREGKTRVAPDELFRLASVSKPITAAAVRKLIREGKLRADDLVWDLLGLAPPPGKTTDPRWKKVTVAHLLDHKGGWDREAAGDPMFKSLAIAKALGKPGPASAEDVVAFMAGEPLQFEPGSKSVYSNFGYCLLGRVIERASGRPYVEYVREEVLAPIGITRVTLGRTLPTDRDPAEPEYIDSATGRNVMKPGQREYVPAPDGSFHLEAMDAHGGLIGSADEVVRFLKAYRTDGRPVGPKPAPGAFFGALPGTFTMLYQRADGVAVVALFNRWHDPAGLDPFEIRRLIDQAADGVRRWPMTEVRAR